MVSDSHTLIRTKLHRTRITHDVVERSRLMEQLDRGLGRRLTLVSAPAGFGKSTLASAWLDTCVLPSAWLSLDEYDNDLLGFLSYLLAAIQSVSPDVGRETQTLLQAPELPPIRVLAGTLINELEEFQDRFVLVLEDYHFIDALSVHSLIDELLRHPPRSLHLVHNGANGYTDRAFP
jgi:LuxR family maltose regulon positive regulatory protein